jgi:hypothetical protein
MAVSAGHCIASIDRPVPGDWEIRRPALDAAPGSTSIIQRSLLHRTLHEKKLEQYRPIATAQLTQFGLFKTIADYMRVIAFPIVQVLTKRRSRGVALHIVHPAPLEEEIGWSSLI